MMGQQLRLRFAIPVGAPAVRTTLPAPVEWEPARKPSPRPVRHVWTTRRLTLILAGLATLASPAALRAQRQPADRVHIQVDTAEAVAVLRIMKVRRAGGQVPDEDWGRLFSTEGYERLQVREAAVKRPFSDSEFAAFVDSDTLGQRAASLQRALSAWEGADLQAAAQRALAYLPSDGRITATIYIVVKPKTNSFVWDVETRPAIFLYLDPDVTAPKFANTVAHELHHIGFASIRSRTDSMLASLPDSVRPAAEWMGAFGEGFAMLTAAGGPDVHPHADSPAADRARWDHDMANVNQDLRTLDSFFLDVIEGRLSTPDTLRAVASTFYGIQGPWYTVGWKMATVIEKRFGRPELIRCMTDPRRLLDRYDAAAADYNRTHADTLATWSPLLLTAMGVQRATRAGGSM